MRCKACDRPDSNPVLGDWYCKDCENVIRKTANNTFTLEDIYGIMLEGDDEETMKEILSHAL